MAENEEPPTQEKLTELTNEANLEYSLKHYNEAAELYSRATEMQTVLRGDEMAPENAELLYLYGRCLFKVAVSKSDVLGGQVAAEKKKASKKEASKIESPGEKLAEDVLEAIVEEKDGSAPAEKKEGKSGQQPFFELVDAEWSDDEDDDEDADADVEAAIEEEDDFATAYEILDVARVLLERQAQAQEELEQNAGRGKTKALPTVDLSPQLRQIKERLADTHDLQAEISLENERFDEAITDFTSAAAIKDELFPKASSIVAEAHYKLSLALEFESLSAVRAAQAQDGEPNMVPANEKPEVNEELREKSRLETGIAVESIKLRVAEEEAKLANLSGEAAKAKGREIEDVKDILKEMEDRLKELHAPAVTMQAQSGSPADAMSGILAQVFGESNAESKARIEEATKNAHDLSGLVKKKKAKPAASSNSNGATSGPAASSTNGKRKLEEEPVDEGEGKRAKTEEMLDVIH